MKEAANAEHRPRSNLSETAALSKIHEQQVVDDTEMAEIRANEELVERMRRGSQKAREWQGRFVE